MNFSPLSSYGLYPHGPHPSPRQLAWYENGLSAFFHFGMNTYTGREWCDGTEDPSLFAPPRPVDVRSWVRAVKEAGYRSAILTAKHHDGFCLWPTKTTGHSIASSPYLKGKGDLVKDFTDACREFGLRAGLYLSPWDRHEPCWGTKDYNGFYLSQLTELLTQYGTVDEIWWDGAGSDKADYDWGRWAYLVRSLQPECIIFGPLGIAPCGDVRWVGNEGGFAGDPCWSTVNAFPACTEDRNSLNHGQADGNAFVPAEVDVSIRPGWFYHSDQDEEVKSPERLVSLWFDSVGRNSALLLNVPPMPDGTLHPTDVKNLRVAHRLLREIFTNNLLTGAQITASSQRNGCAPELLLSDSPTGFYAAQETDLTPSLCFSLPQKESFNCLRLGEKIELGHRIRSWECEALVDGVWRPLAQGTCVGHLWACRFETVTTDQLRLRINKADCSPVLREFGIYFIKDEVFATESTLRSCEDLLAKPSAKVTQKENEFILAFGGIYDYNTVAFDSCNAFSYKLYSFNGSTWDEIAKGRPAARETVRFATVRGSYQAKLVLGDGYNGGEVRPRVYCQKDEK